MTAVPLLALATFLALVPVTLLVPGLAELVRGAHGGTRFEAHLFMAVNMCTGMAAVPLVMRALRRWPNVRAWLVLLLAADAVLFVAMGLAPSLGALMAARALDGAAHLPAVTVLMVAANRFAGHRRGATLGALAAAIMAGVAVGGPLGGWLVQHGPAAVYGAGAGILALGVGVVLLVPPVPAAQAAADPRRRYRFNVRAPHAWAPLVLGFMDRFTVGIFVSTFTLYLGEVLRLAPAARGGLIALFMVPFAVLSYPAGRLTDRIGWLRPLLVGNVGFGVVYASYGLVGPALLPAAMVASGVMSALMYAPNLVLVAETVRRGVGEGLFGAFQVAGSLGFLVGPVAGGVLVELSRRLTGEVAWAAIFVAVGALTSAVGLAAWAVLRGQERHWVAGAATQGSGAD